MTRQASSAEMARVPLPRLLTVRELADLLQVPPETIYAWRYKGIGPPAIPVGRYLRFRAEDVVAWRYLLIVPGPDAPEAVLFCFPSAERERRAREVLRRPGLPVATTSLQRHLPNPLGPVWRPVDQDRRLRLIDIAEEATHG